MEATLSERAVNGLHDFAAHLRREFGDTSDDRMRTRAERTPHVRPVSAVEQARRDKVVLLTDLWEAAREREWRAAGRLTADGALRLTGAARPPWTLEAVERAFPELTGLDRWAVLIAADGTCKESDMTKDPTQNVREVFRDILKHELDHMLPQKLMTLLEGVRARQAEDTPVPLDRLSKVRVGQAHQVHRVRHPETGELVSEAERATWNEAHPEVRGEAGA